MSYAITSQASCTKAVMMKCLCECPLCHLIIKHTYKCTLICMFVCMLLSRRRSRHCAYICTYICNWGISLTNTRTLRLCVCVFVRQFANVIHWHWPVVNVTYLLTWMASLWPSLQTCWLVPRHLLQKRILNSCRLRYFRFLSLINFQLHSSCVYAGKWTIVGLALCSEELVQLCGGTRNDSEQVRCKVNNTTKQWSLSDNTIFTLSWPLLCNWLFYVKFECFK